MNNLSLTARSIWIREKNPGKNNTVNIVNLNKKIKGEKKEYDDFFELLKDFCQKYSRKFVLNDSEQKMFKVETENINIQENEKFRYTYIDINSGGYGIEANIVNTKTNKILYTRKKNMLRLYILGCFLLCQRMMIHVKVLLYFKILDNME